jgi:hypothetical protein
MCLMAMRRTIVTIHKNVIYLGLDLGLGILRH